MEKMVQGSRKKPLNVVGNPELELNPGIFNGFFITVGHSHTPRGRVMFNEFNLHAQLPGITCYRLQVVCYSYERTCRRFASVLGMSE